MTRHFFSPRSADTGIRRRVTHLIDGLGHGGAERLLTPILVGLRGAGFEASVVALQDKDGSPEAERLRDHGVRVTFMPIDKIRRIDQLLAAWRQLRSEGPTLIHAHLQFSILLAGSLGRWAKIPAVATLHTDGMHCDSLGAGLRMALMKHSLNHWVDRVITLSPASLAQASADGLGKARLTLLPNGVDLSRFTPNQTAQRDRDTMRASLSIAPGETLVLCVAVLRAEKGIGRLLTALSQLPQDAAPLRAVIVGEGSERFRLETQAAQAKLGDKVMFLGYRGDVAALMQAADLFVLPTLTDALPTVIIEAMASGLPIIASAVGGIPHMIEDGVEGLLVTPGDPHELSGALAELSWNRQKRTALAQAARHRAERDFALDVQLARLAALYEELIKTKGAPR
jgi:glycosyltransferase involved in cell wall biosynthesis